MALNEVQQGNVKSAFHKFSYGMFIITTESDGKINGQAANTGIQLSSDPNLYAVCINKGNYTWELMSKSKKIALHIMGQDSLQVIGNFGFKSGRDGNKFEGWNYTLSENGVPLLKENALAILEGEVKDIIDAGTHYLCSCLVTDGYINEQKKDILPMTYNDFRKLKKGGTLSQNKEAEKTEKKEGNKMQKYICDLCGWVYDPEEQGGVAFEDLPDDWVCPMCGAPKDQFSLEN